MATRKKAKSKESTTPPVAIPIAAPLTTSPAYAESAVSPDGRLVAKLLVTNDFHGMWHEDMSWFIEVRYAADSELLFSTSRSWSGYADDSDDHRATGEYVTGVAFDAAGNLLVHERVDDQMRDEVLALPPPLRIPRGVVRAACETALRIAWPERWEILVDGVETLLWPRAENCRLCSAARSEDAAICERCRAFARRRAASPLPEAAMVVTETIRALRAADSPADRLDEIVSFLEERLALVVPASPPRPCHFCGEPKEKLSGPGALANPADLLSPASRVCAPCIRALSPQG